MKNLNEYFTKIKNENTVIESDFQNILSLLEKEEAVCVGENNYYSVFTVDKIVTAVKSPFTAWGFGFSGFALAAFMLFVNTTSPAAQNITLANSDGNIQKNSISETIMFVDNINSFDYYAAESSTEEI